MSCGEQQEERYISKEALKRFPAVESRGAPWSPVKARSSSPRPFWKKLSWNRPQSQLHGDPVAHLAILQSSRSRKDLSSSSSPRHTEPEIQPRLPSLFGVGKSASLPPTESANVSCGGGYYSTTSVHDMPQILDPSLALSKPLLQYLAKSTSTASLQALETTGETSSPERPETSPTRHCPGKLPTLEAKHDERNRSLPKQDVALGSARSKTSKDGKKDSGTVASAKEGEGRTGRPRHPTKIANPRALSSSGNDTSKSRSPASRSSAKRAKPRPKPVNHRATLVEDQEEIKFAVDDDELQEEPVVRIRERANSNFIACKRRSTAVEYKDEFQYLLALMRRHHLSLDELKAKRNEFNVYDSRACGVIGKAEFHQLVRKRCSYLPHESLPEYLISDHWLDDSGEWMDFEMYLLWSLSTAYSEEFMVKDPKERHLRQVARTNKIKNYLYVEKVKNVFDSFDEDQSDHIDESEFAKVIYVLMNARHPSDISPQMLKRFWREVDTDGSGEITFEEFLLWYFKFMGDPDAGRIPSPKKKTR